jgi:hypothetical protein
MKASNAFKIQALDTCFQLQISMVEHLAVAKNIFRLNE